MRYVPPAHLTERIDNDFTFHPAEGDQADRYSAVRRRCKELAHELTTLAPTSRELSIAINKLEEVMFWTNAAIARNENTSE